MNVTISTIGSALKSRHHHVEHPQVCVQQSQLDYMPESSVHHSAMATPVSDVSLVRSLLVNFQATLDIDPLHPYSTSGT